MNKNFKILSILGIAFTISLSGCDNFNGKVKVSFDWNYECEHEVPKTRYFAPGETYGELPTPSFERYGYNFGGWNVRKDGKGDNVTSETVIEEGMENHTLFANWEGKKYTVSFELNGGNINGATYLDPRVVTYGNIYGGLVIPNNPSRKLSNFLGWFLNEEGTGEPITYKSKVEIAADHTLYAIFKDLKSEFAFDDEEDIDSFIDVYGNLNLSIEEEGMVVKNQSSDPRGYLELPTPLTAGSSVEIDVEFKGDADKEQGIKAGFYAYGSDGYGSVISSGYLPSPREESTRRQIKQWYWGQGNNSLNPDHASWEKAPEWNNGHLVYKMNILENCGGIIFLMDFGRKEVDDDYDPDISYWISNSWVFHSLKINYMDYENVKSEYEFASEDELKSLANDENVQYALVDGGLKVERVNGAELEGYLDLKTGFIEKGATIDFEVTFYGDTSFAYNGGVRTNWVGLFTYGAYPDGKRLDAKEDEHNSPITDEDPQNLKDWYYGAYNASNESWAQIKLTNGEKVTFRNYVFEDIYAIKMVFKFGDYNGYFVVNSIKINTDPEITYYNFLRESQLRDFDYASNISYEIEEGEEDNYLKITQEQEGHGFINLRRLIERGKKITLEVECVTDNATYSSGNQFTFLAYYAKYNGSSSGTTALVKGNASWDDGWDGSKIELEIDYDDAYYGLRFEFVFNNPNTYFKLSNISII